MAGGHTNRGARGTASGAALVVLVAALAACGGGGGAAAPPAPPRPAVAPQVAAFCDAAVSLEAALANPPPADPNSPPDQVKATVQAYGAQVEPTLASVEQTAPDAVRQNAATMAQAARAAFAAGDLAQLNEQAFGAAKSDLERYMLAGCGYPQVRVTATEYRYDGLPATLPPGNTAFTLSNEGAEIHELQLARVADGVTDSLDQLLSLKGNEYTSKLTPVAGAGTGPASLATEFVWLTPGRYIAVDFIPQGTKPGVDGTGPQHYVLGMKGEITVA